MRVTRSTGENDWLASGWRHILERSPLTRSIERGTAQMLCAIVAKGAMPPLVLAVDDCRAAYDGMRARGVEFTQEPMDRYGTVDAGFRDPSGNGWKMIEARR